MSRNANKTWMILLQLLLLVASTARAGDEHENSRGEAILYLRDGDYLTGRLMECAEPEIVRWQMHGATKPFDLRAAAVRAVHFPFPPANLQANGEFAIELTDGDLLFGSLAGTSSDVFEFESPALGYMRIDRQEIRRITVVDGAGNFVYRGPNGLADWEPAKAEQWREEGGRLISNAPRAQIKKEFKWPKRARLEFEVSWTGQPEFLMTIAAGDSDEELKEGYRFEVWQNSLVVIRALGDYADVAIVCELDPSDKRIHFEAFVDQERGSMIVCGTDGKQLAEINVAPEHVKHGKTLECLSIVNGGTEFRLEALAVSRWSGQLPPLLDADKPGLLLVDGTVRYGEVIGYDAKNRNFKLRSLDTTDESEVGVNEVANVFRCPKTHPTGYTYHVALFDGSRISGELSKVEAGRVYLKRRGIKEPVTCPTNQILSLIATHEFAKPPAVDGRLGRLEIDGVRLHGTLAATAKPPADSETCLVWLPRWSNTKSPLDPKVSGQIIYRDSAPKPKIAPRRQREFERMQQLRRGQARPAGFWGQVARVFAGDASPSSTPPKSSDKGMLYTMSGDCIPYDSTTIDEQGVHFKSSFVDATFIPHDRMKAIELVPNWTAVALADEKRQRLLTLPRMQKPNPPTHLLASTGGDFLRARLISMSGDKLKLESRLETKQIPRDRVACIIWLNDAKNVETPVTADASPAGPNGSPRVVQAVRSDGPRLAFSPHHCTGGTLLGTSPLHGECHVRLADIDVLNLGEAIDRSAEEQPFQEWRLADAVQPNYLHDDDQANGNGATTNSSLIGKLAPDVRLKLLDGNDFLLADHKGHVVVLDFWASWCGPCMQAMPEIESVVNEFADQGVRLIAVNMQEDQAAIQSALERLKISPTVALDVDGALAEHYQVTAIPQTVVIGADGVVAGLLIGAAPGMPDELRGLLKGQLAETK